MSSGRLGFIAIRSTQARCRIIDVRYYVSQTWRVVQFALFIGPISALPTAPALAEVCDKERPLWNPASGPVGPVEELLFQLVTPAGLITMVVFVTFAVLRGPISAIGASVLFGLLGASNLFKPYDDNAVSQSIYQASLTEGCVGSPWLANIVWFSLCLALFLYGLRELRRRRGGNGGSADIA